MGRHAYCIIAHNNPRQLFALIDLLNDQRNDIYIHIDKKVDIRKFTPPINIHANIKFIPNRVKVYWGDYSQIVCELNLLEAAIQSGVEYDYIHLLSGVDLPLKSQNEIHSFFDSHTGEEFIEFSTSEFNLKDLKSKTEFPVLFGKYLSREDWFAKYIGRNLYRCSHHLVRGLGIRAKYTVQLQKGPNWFSITGGLATWLVSHRKEIIKTFRYAWCCDEMMLQTYAPISPFAKNISPLGNLRKIDWTRGTPYVWRNEDFDELMRSDALFARKFSLTDEPEIIHRIIEKLK